MDEQITTFNARIRKSIIDAFKESIKVRNRTSPMRVTMTDAISEFMIKHSDKWK